MYQVQVLCLLVPGAYFILQYMANTTLRTRKDSYQSDSSNFESSLSPTQKNGNEDCSSHKHVTVLQRRIPCVQYYKNVLPMLTYARLQGVGEKIF